MEDEQGDFIRVYIARGKELLLYRPGGNGLQRAADRILTGRIKEIDGIEWAIFGRYGGFGIPLTDPHDDRYDCDLELAEKYYHDVERYVRSSEPFSQETTP